MKRYNYGSPMVPPMHYQGGTTAANYNPWDWAWLNQANGWLNRNSAPNVNTQAPVMPAMPQQVAPVVTPPVMGGATVEGTDPYGGQFLDQRLKLNSNTGGLLGPETDPLSNEEPYRLPRVQNAGGSPAETEQLRLANNEKIRTLAKTYKKGSPLRTKLMNQISHQKGVAPNMTSYNNITNGSQGTGTQVKGTTNQGPRDPSNLNSYGVFGDTNNSIEVASANNIPGSPYNAPTQNTMQYRPQLPTNTGTGLTEAQVPIMTNTGNTLTRAILPPRNTNTGAFLNEASLPPIPATPEMTKTQQLVELQKRAEAGDDEAIRLLQQNELANAAALVDTPIKEEAITEKQILADRYQGDRLSLDKQRNRLTSDVAGLKQAIEDNLGGADGVEYNKTRLEQLEADLKNNEDKAKDLTSKENKLTEVIAAETEEEEPAKELVGSGRGDRRGNQGEVASEYHNPDGSRVTTYNDGNSVTVDAQGNLSVTGASPTGTGETVTTPPVNKETTNKIGGLLQQFFGIDETAITQAIGLYLLSRATGASHVGAMRWAGGTAIKNAGTRSANKAAKAKLDESRAYTRSEEDRKNEEKYNALIAAGYTPESARAAVRTGVTGLLSKGGTGRKRTGNSERINVDGVRGLDSEKTIYAYEEEDADGNKGMYVQYEGVSVPLDQFESIVRQQGGSIDFKPLSSADKAAAVASWSAMIKDEYIDTLVGEKSLTAEQANNAAKDVGSHFKGIKLSDKTIAAEATKIVGIALGNYKAAVLNKENPSGLAPFLLDAEMTGEILGGRDSIWKLDKGKGMVDNKAKNSMYDTLLNQANNDKEVAKASLEALWKSFNKEKDENSNLYKSLKPTRKVENKFLVYVNKMLAKTAKK